MSDVVMKSVIFPGNRVLVWLTFLLASSLILAENGDRFELPPSYNDDISEEIYHSASEWRESTPTENDWRAPPKQKKKYGRITYDLDSAYEQAEREQMSDRENVRINTGQTELRDTINKDNLFRLEF
jgi:hypothetical protein